MSEIDNARNYIGARFGSSYRAWEALSEDDQERTLVSASDYFDRLTWQGTATHVLDGQPWSRQWPRSGLMRDGQPVDPLTIPVEVMQATYELAVLIGNDESVITATDSGSNVQSLGAGPASISFFRPTSAVDGTATRLPQVINQLVGRWLATAAGRGGIGGFVSGSSAASNFRDCSSCGAASGSCGCGAGQRRDVRWPV